MKSDVDRLLREALEIAAEYQRLERVCISEAADAVSGDALIQATEAARLLARAALDKVALARQVIEMKESSVNAEEIMKDAEEIEKKVREILGIKYK